MSTTTERIANNHTLVDVVTLATKRDSEAAQYLSMIAFAARIIDDLHDQDHPVTPDQILRLAQILLVDIHRQPFFQKHRDFLTGCQQIALNAWQDANELEANPSPLKAVYAHVLRDTINELAPAVAYLVDGAEHARTVSRIMREKFMKELE